MIEKSFPLTAVLRWASEITGKSETSSRTQLLDIIRESLESLHNEESLENLRKWCIYSCGNTITMPKELADPIRYKIGTKIGPVRNKAYEFIGYARGVDTEGFKSDLSYIGEFPTLFGLPTEGARVAARSLEFYTGSTNAPYLVVQGIDIFGREVFTNTPEGTDVGERVYISQPDKAPIYTKTIFKKITAVRIVNSQINIQLIWCKALKYGDAPSSIGLLSYYDPGEEIPTFRKYSIGISGNESYSVEVLGLLRQPELRYDNELIRGFDSGAIKNMIRANYYKAKNDMQGAQFNASLAMSSIRKKNEKMSPNTDIIDVNLETCAGKFPEVF